MDVLRMLLEITLYSAIIFFAILLFKKIFKSKLSPAMHFAIWSLLILRLVIPFTADSKVKFFTYDQVEEIQQESQPTTVQSIISAPKTTPITLPIANNAIIPQNLIKNDQNQLKQTTNIKSTSDKTSVELSVADILLMIWVTGMGVSLLYFIYLRYKLKRQIKNDYIRPDKYLLNLLMECKREMGIKRLVHIVYQKDMHSPALFFPNIILMPYDMKNMNYVQLKMAIAHELMHLQRKDSLVCFLMMALLGVYWFNPIVWFAHKLIREDMESACDAKVVKYMNQEERKTYATTILALFSKQASSQLVLGMALGSNKTVAEKRIRGIFMKSKSKKSIITALGMVTAILVVTCFSTACQPTPKTAPVVNKEQGVQINEPMQTQAPQGEEINYYATAYKTQEHWTEEIETNKKLTVVADVDILVPEDMKEQYPVQLIEKHVLTQEKADEVLKYFAGEDFKLYEGIVPLTKSYYEEELIRLKQSLAKSEAGEDGESPESIRRIIKETEAKYAAAPKSVEQKSANTLFTYPRNLETGEEQTQRGKNSIDVSVALSDGTFASFYASRVNSDEGYSDASSYIMYGKGEITLYEDMLKYNIELREEDLEKMRNSDITDEEYIATLQSELATLNEELAFLEQNTINMDEMQEKAIQVLKDLNITDVKTTSFQRAIFVPYDETFGQEWRNIQPKGKEHCVIFEFSRQNSGVSTVSQNSGNVFSAESIAEMYAAPFGVEKVRVTLDGNGKVLDFSWSDISEIKEISLAKNEMISLEDAKMRAANHLGFLYNPSIENDDLLKLISFEVVDARLVMAYINVKDNLNAAMIVPAWCFKTQGYSVYSATEEKFRFNEEMVIINALDGSPILMPGSHNYATAEPTPTATPPITDETDETDEQVASIGVQNEVEAAEVPALALAPAQ